ncbi:MAG TPA: thioredoxin family protein [Chitinophaga sp.]|uniref:thioredoxin family protein n=1 Tax=Chitinophaga sp. TaxID=1869181 RepID=UPI002C220322|nr:thioredoxin family protein [Chitinophaga sp.]HVI44925.1 thioredoxin family protein [Chitinophaga sp.]
MKCLILLLSTIFPRNSDTTYIKFESQTSWQQILTEAKRSNKYVFVDCFATWCGPCKYMADSIFTTKAAADYMNTNFINLKVQMDVTSKDNQEIKNWYKDAKMIMQKYDIKGFPTFLFLSPDGELVYQAIGGVADAGSFITKAKKALDPDEQYFFLLEQYNKGYKNQAFIARLITAADKSGDQQMVTKLKKELTTDRN